jgi:hypothetical protein
MRTNRDNLPGISARKAPHSWDSFVKTLRALPGRTRWDGFLRTLQEWPIPRKGGERKCAR